MSGGARHQPEFLAVVLENAELRQQLAEVQDQCIELAVDAGGLHAEIEGLRTQLLAAERACEQWRILADQRLASRPGSSQVLSKPSDGASPLNPRGFHLAAPLQYSRFS